MSQEEKQALREAAARAKRERREARERAEEAAKMGLRALLGARLEARAGEMAERLESLALSEDDQIALRGIELWLSRVWGKAVQPTREEASVELPADLQAIKDMTPEERRALLRSLSDDTPSLPRSTELNPVLQVRSDLARARNGGSDAVH